MSIVEIVLLAIVLAMDAFAVSVCKGISVKELKIGHGITCGLYFGIFQALMPIIGYFAGKSFTDLISDYDHWIAFALLAFIGISMIRESRDEKEVTADFGFKGMIIMALATSIDALAVGVTLAFLDVNIALASSLIGIITAIISCVGVMLGNLIGKRYGKVSEMIGGIILIVLGLKILLEHLGIIAF